jgi:hypothetical protein
MSLLVKQNPKRKYELASEGTHAAKLEEVRDLGEVETGFGKKQKVLFIWEMMDQTDQRGFPVKVFERFTRTLHEKGLLAKRLKQMLEKVPPEIDLTEPVGWQGDVVVQHNDTGDEIYANIIAVLRPPTAEEATSEARVKRTIAAYSSHKVVATAPAAQRPQITDADVPF